MSISKVNAGGAQVTLSIRDRTRQGLHRARQNLTAFAASTAKIGAGLFAGGTAISAPFALSIKEFAKTEQLLGRVSSIFQDLEGDANKFADGFAGKINQSGLEIRDHLTRFQAILKGAGVRNEDAFGLSKGLAVAAQDLIAFDDTITHSDEAVRRLISGLAGETEAVRKFGADVRASAVDQELLAQGLQVSAENASEAQRQMARYNIIMRALQRSGAAGQAAREVNTLASRMRGFFAVLRDIRSKVGEALKPIGVFIAKGIELGRAFETFVEENQQVVQAVAIAGVAITGLGGLLLGVGAAAQVAAFAFAGIGGAIGVLTGAISLLGPLPIVLTAIAAGAVAVAKNFGGIRDIIAGAFEPLIPFFQQIFSTLGQVVEGVGDALRGDQLELAARIGLHGVELAFREATQGITGAWNEMTIGIARAILTTTDEVAHLFDSFVVSMGQGFIAVGIEIKNVFRAVDSFVAETAKNILNEFQRINDFLAKFRIVDIGLDVSSSVKDLEEQIQNNKENIRGDLLQFGENSGRANAALQERREKRSRDLLDQLEQLDMVGDEQKRTSDERLKQLREEFDASRARARQARIDFEKIEKPDAFKEFTFGPGVDTVGGKTAGTFFGRSAEQFFGAGEQKPLQTLVDRAEEGNTIARKMLKGIDAIARRRGIDLRFG